MFTINLRDAWKAPRIRRVSTAVRVLKAELRKHVKRTVKLDESLNAVLWARGIKKPPRRVKVRVRITKTEAKAFPAK